MSIRINHLDHKLSDEERAYLNSRGRRSEILVNDRMFAEDGEGAGDEETWEELVQGLTVAELKAELGARGQDTSGNKAELQERLIHDGPDEED